MPRRSTLSIISTTSELKTYGAERLAIGSGICRLILVNDKSEYAATILNIPDASAASSRVDGSV